MQDKRYTKRDFALSLQKIFSKEFYCIVSYLGGRGFPVRRYPVALRLRDRKGRAILCVALFPHCGDSSGATLGVRSVALLHVTVPYPSRKRVVRKFFILTFTF